MIGHALWRRGRGSPQARHCQGGLRARHSWLSTCRARTPPPSQALVALHQLSVGGEPPAAALQAHLRALGRLVDLSQEALVSALGALVTVLRRVRRAGRTGARLAPAERGGRASTARCSRMRGLRAVWSASTRNSPSPALRRGTRQAGVAADAASDAAGGVGGGLVAVDSLADMALKGCAQGRPCLSAVVELPRWPD